MARILGLGETFPAFQTEALVSLEKGKEFLNLDQNSLRGKWSVLFFWPMDFTVVCPTELVQFNRDLKQFRDRETQVFGVSTDTHFVHLAWRNSHPDLKNINIPMLADHRKELSEALGVLHPQDKVAYRATFIVDPDLIIRWVSVNDMNVGRNVKEILRTLDALQSDELCPCNWEKGDPTLVP